jgi:hypothetical protein
MWLVDKRFFACIKTKIAGTTIIHFVVWQHNRVKHGFEIGCFVCSI